jgi:hypothetical protein
MMTVTPEIRSDIKKESVFALRLRQESDKPITTPSERMMAGERLVLVKGRLKGIKVMEETVTKPLSVALKAAKALFTPAKEALTMAEANYKKHLGEYEMQAQRERALAEARAQEAMRKEREKLEKQADKLAAKGKIELAEAKRAEAEGLIAPIVTVGDDKLTGISGRNKWIGHVVDPIAFARGVADGIIPVSALTYVQGEINRNAERLEGELDWPGVRVEKKWVSSVRADAVVD